MHCFTETWDVAQGALDLGFHISFSGIVTFKNAVELKEVARRVPLDRMLIETDSPYLAPVPHRGKRNQPAFVRYVGEEIARLRGAARRRDRRGHVRQFLSTVRDSTRPCVSSLASCCSSSSLLAAPRAPTCTRTSSSRSTTTASPQVREFLAKGVDPNTVGPNGEPALVLAARADYAATVDALLAAKANVNARSAVGDSAIMAAALNGHLDLVKKLRARGAEINNAGWTPLIYAATGGHDAIVEYLLAEGANVNAVSPNGTSALMMAVREGKGSTVTLLIAKGADVNQKNQAGGTALAWATARQRAGRWRRRLRRAGAKE